jgi:ferredoxin
MSDTAMRVRVDDNRCQGHNLCHRAVPEIFRVREDDGHAYVDTEEVAADLQGRVRLAVLNCPEGAIHIVSK